MSDGKVVEPNYAAIDLVSAQMLERVYVALSSGQLMAAEAVSCGVCALSAIVAAAVEPGDDDGIVEALMGQVKAEVAMRRKGSVS